MQTDILKRSTSTLTKQLKRRLAEKKFSSLDPETGERRRLSFHSIRKFVATELSRAGYTELRIGDLLGHKGVRAGKSSLVTAIYIQPASLGQLQEMVESLPVEGFPA